MEDYGLSVRRKTYLYRTGDYFPQATADVTYQSRCTCCYIHSNAALMETRQFADYQSRSIAAKTRHADWYTMMETCSSDTLCLKPNIFIWLTTLIPGGRGSRPGQVTTRGWKKRRKMSKQQWNNEAGDQKRKNAG